MVISENEKQMKKKIITICTEAQTQTCGCGFLWIGWPPCCIV